MRAISLTGALILPYYMFVSYMDERFEYGSNFENRMMLALGFSLFLFAAIYLFSFKQVGLPRVSDTTDKKTVRKRVVEMNDFDKGEIERTIQRIRNDLLWLLVLMTMPLIVIFFIFLAFFSDWEWLFPITIIVYAGPVLLVIALTILALVLNRSFNRFYKLTDRNTGHHLSGRVISYSGVAVTGVAGIYAMDMTIVDPVLDVLTFLPMGAGLVMLGFNLYMLDLVSSAKIKVSLALNGLALSLSGVSFLSYLGGSDSVFIILANPIMANICYLAICCILAYESRRMDLKVKKIFTESKMVREIPPWDV